MAQIVDRYGACLRCQIPFYIGYDDPPITVERYRIMHTPGVGMSPICVECYAACDVEGVMQYVDKLLGMWARSPRRNLEGVRESVLSQVRLEKLEGSL